MFTCFCLEKQYTYIDTRKKRKAIERFRVYKTIILCLCVITVFCLAHDRKIETMQRWQSNY